VFKNEHAEKECYHKMKKPKLLFATALLILAPLFVSPAAHGATGIVCISDPLNFSDCSTPASFQSASFAPGTTISVNVNVQGSDALNGFDIQVFADNTVLNATSVSLASGLLPSASTNTLAECINLVLIKGQACAPQDGLGVVHLAAVATGFLTVAPTSGNLFTINYKIIGRGTTGISFNTGCTGTSTANTCDTITTGQATPASETVTNGSFSNVNDFSLTVNPSSTSQLPGATGMSTVSLKALGFFADTVNLAVAASPGVTASLAASSFALSGGSSASTTVSYSSPTTQVSPPYQVSVTGTAFVGGQTQTATVSLIVSPPDFGIAASTTSLTVPQGGSDTSTITITSITGFTGTVGLSTSTSGVTAALSTNSIPGASGTATLTVSAASSLATGSYSVLVTGMSGSLTHSVTVAVTVPPPDFSITAIPNAVDNQNVNAPVSTAANVQSLFNFAGTVSITAVVAGAGTVGPATPMTALIIPNTVTLTAGALKTSTIIVDEPVGASLGNYTVTITGTSGSLVHTTILSFTIVDYSVAISATSFVAYQGQRATFFIGAEGLGGNTGFGVANLQSNFVGFNCIRVIVPVIRTTAPICVSGVPGGGNIYFFNTTLNQYVLVPNDQGLVQAGIVPVVRFVERAVFPLPINSPLCFAFGYNDTNTHCDIGSIATPTDIANNEGNGVAQVRVHAFAQTIPGTYKVFIGSGAGTLEHDLGNITIVVPTPAEVNQLHFKHHLSLSKDGNAQTYIVGITNPNTDFSLNVIITIKAIDVANPLTVLFVASANFVLAPGQTINNIVLTQALTTALLGHTFSFQVTLKWGVVGMKQSGRSTLAVPGSLVPTAGSYTIFPSFLFLFDPERSLG
jgi:hypothetical protein